MHSILLNYDLEIGGNAASADPEGLNKNSFIVRRPVREKNGRIAAGIAVCRNHIAHNHGERGSIASGNGGTAGRHRDIYSGSRDRSSGERTR